MHRGEMKRHRPVPLAALATTHSTDCLTSSSISSCRLWMSLCNSYHTIHRHISLWARRSTEKATGSTDKAGKQYTSKKNKPSRWTKTGGSYQLPHIYDYLLSMAVTPGGQSFRQNINNLFQN